MINPIVQGQGSIKGKAVRSTITFNPREDFYEQSSENIWSCCCEAVRAAIAISGIASERICGVGFDGTCSMVVLDSNFQPVTVSLEGETDRDVILWMDHRAALQVLPYTHALGGSHSGAIFHPLISPRCLQAPRPNASPLAAIASSTRWAAPCLLRCRHPNCSGSKSSGAKRHVVWQVHKMVGGCIRRGQM